MFHNVPQRPAVSRNPNMKAFITDDATSIFAVTIEEYSVVVRPPILHTS